MRNRLLRFEDVMTYGTGEDGGLKLEAKVGLRIYHDGATTTAKKNQAGMIVAENEVELFKHLAGWVEQGGTLDSLADEIRNVRQDDSDRNVSSREGEN